MDLSSHLLHTSTWELIKSQDLMLMAIFIVIQGKYTNRSRTRVHMTDAPSVMNMKKSLWICMTDVIQNHSVNYVMINAQLTFFEMSLLGQIGIKQDNTTCHNTMLPHST